MVTNTYSVSACVVTYIPPGNYALVRSGCGAKMRRDFGNFGLEGTAVSTGGAAVAFEHYSFRS